MTFPISIIDLNRPIYLQGKKRKKLEGLKLGPAADGEEMFEPALDAEFVDVFKGTHGVVFLFDITKMWTFEYIDRELPKVPAHIPGTCSVHYRT